MTHRYLIISALAKGVSVIENPLESDDTLATMEVLRKLGIQVEVKGDKLKVTGGSIQSPRSVIDCKESGTTLRLAIGLCSLLEKPCTLTGAPSLIRRPNKPLLDALNQLGVQTQSKNGHPPITLKGKLKGGKAKIRGDVSSQFISSIILAAPYADNPVDLEITTRLESKPYVELSLDAMKKSGVETLYSENLNMIIVPKGLYKPQITRIEGDWSSAAYMLAAGVMTGKVHVENLDIQSRQADREIIQILDQMGANIKINGERVTTEKSCLTAIELDMRDYPDIFPIVACLCSVAEGTSKLTGLRRLKIKESDRLSAVIDGLERMGINITRTDDSVTIKGGKPIKAKIDPHNDHRIAMSFAILAHKADGETIIMKPECVSKSYPSFWEDLKKIGAKIK
jgi:3-phosphoshikimate 1-carboxyvinyltransferase